MRAAWDALHIGEANVLLLPLPKNYAAGAMAVKAAAGLLFALFAFPR